MKILPALLAAASALLLSSCADTYYAEEAHLHPVGPRVIPGEPVRVERHRYVEEPPVVVERYSGSTPPSYTRPYYGDPVPSTTYRRTTTRTYQGY
ncbi:MAG: hypothetical protein V4675_09265 [Verrucomicrobiota bacterium]